MSDETDQVIDDEPSSLNYVQDDILKKIHRASMKGDLETLKLIYEEKKATDWGMAFDLACENGQYDTAQYLLKIAPESGSCRSVDWAAGNNHLRLVILAHDAGYRGTELAMDLASKNGHIYTLNWLHKIGKYRCSENAFNWAAANNQLEVVKYLASRYLSVCTTDAMDFAARNGHLEMLEWLHENIEADCTYRAMDFAAENGLLQVMEWLHLNRGLNPTTITLRVASIRDQLNVLGWITDKFPQILECVAPRVEDPVSIHVQPEYTDTFEYFE